MAATFGRMVLSGMHGMKKLSPVMSKALIAIAASGGRAIAEGGGWWKGADGERLSYVSDTVQDTVATNTIYALQERGLLAVDPKDPQRTRWHQRTRLLTNEGRRIAADLTKHAGG